MPSQVEVNGNLDLRFGNYRPFNDVGCHDQRVTVYFMTAQP